MYCTTILSHGGHTGTKKGMLSEHATCVGCPVADD